MEWIAIVVAVVFVVLGVICAFSVLLGLPGSWVMLGLALIIEFFDRYYLPEGDRQTFSWWALGACFALAALAEVLEFFAGALGAKRAGSSKKGVLGAVIGGLVGAVLGVALPFPILGSLIGAFIGTFGGAVVGELADQDKSLKETLRPATGATIGRILGTLSKAPIAIAMWAILSISAFWR